MKFFFLLLALIPSSLAFAFDSRTTLSCANQTKIEIFDNLSNGLPPLNEAFALISTSNDELLPPGQVDKSQTRYVSAGSYQYSISTHTADFSLNDGTLNLKNCAISKLETISK